MRRLPKTPKLFFFTANNRTQLNVLEEIGVRNVLVSYKYVKVFLDDIINTFDNVLLVPGNVPSVDDYHEFVKTHIDKLYLATQYDVPYKMEETLKYFTKGHASGVTPVLTQHYLNHLSRLSSIIDEDIFICLGKMKSRIEEDEQIKRLPKLYKFHGLAKGRYLNNPILVSLDSSAWLAGVRGRKCEVYDGTPKQVMLSGTKRRADSGQLQYYLGKYSNYLERINLDRQDVIEGDYTALMKLPHAVYYIPMFKSLGMESVNYRTDRTS